jgi:hypothetical protein
MWRKLFVLSGWAVLFAAGGAAAQAPAPPPPYGPPIGIADAKKGCCCGDHGSCGGGVCAGRDRHRRSWRVSHLFLAYGQYHARLSRNRDRKSPLSGALPKADKSMGRCSRGWAQCNSCAARGRTSRRGRADNLRWKNCRRDRGQRWDHATRRSGGKGGCCSDQIAFDHDFGSLNTCPG